MLVYIHVPFCARRCSYCDFAIAVRKEIPSQSFAHLIGQEWRLRQSLPWWSTSPEVETVYFGGGTPSRLDPQALDQILREIAAVRTVVAGAEITLEANPDDVSPERAEAWRRMGINRVSLGAQSFDPAVLEWMHRTHSADQIGRAVGLLRAAGFDNISVDLIYGLPEELARNWPADFSRALELAPEHLSLYALTVESGTPLGKWTTRGSVRPLPDDRVADEYLWAHERLEQAGFEHYEVSNAGRPGHHARHNAGYWERKPFIGLGPSAHGGAGRERMWNLREWESWRRTMAAGTDPVGGREELTGPQLELEERYLGLRTSAGVAEALVPGPHRSRWLEQGWAKVREGRVYLTPEGWLRLDALVAAV